MVKILHRVWVTSLLQSQYKLLKHLPLSNYISRHKSASAEDTILVCEPFPNNLPYTPFNCEILMCFPSVQPLCCTESTSTAWHISLPITLEMYIRKNTVLSLKGAHWVDSECFVRSLKEIIA